MLQLQLISANLVPAGSKVLRRTPHFLPPSRKRTDNREKLSSVFFSSSPAFNTWAKKGAEEKKKQEEEKK